MANSYDVLGRVALVTGGASGIGDAAAARLRAGGARIALLDRDPRTLAAAAERHDALAIEADVTSSRAVDAAIAHVERELGRLDVLVNCAGISGESLAAVELDDAEWARVMAVNATGVFYCCRAVIPGMTRRRYGRIVSMASIAGKEGNPRGIAYAASKAAVISITQSLGRDLAGSGVLVNCLAPAIIDTPLLAGWSRAHVDAMVARIPLGRMGSVEEVASLIAYLASEEMSFSTGACFDLSGGRATY
jgi:3-oxoacyl-[acyl-carrier protein] reductase